MSSNNVVVDGVVLPGFDPTRAQADLARLTGQPEERVKSLLVGKPVIVRRNVDEATAERYVAALQRIGVSARTESTERLELEFDEPLTSPAATSDALLTRDGVAGSAVQETPSPALRSLATTAIVEPPQDSSTDSAGPGPTEQTPTPRLWNPNAATAWSLLFSPILGAVLVAKNWTSLGVPQNRSTAIWSGWAMAVFMVASPFLPDWVTAGTQGIAAGVVAGFYWGVARPQSKFIVDRYGKQYPRKGWLAPIGLGIVAIAGYVAYCVAVVVFFSKDQ